jgi:intracellular septation protein
MKILVDLFPVLAFFAAFKLADNPQQGILLATAVAIIASLVQVAFVWAKHRRVETMHLVTLGLITVLGGLTLILQDERLIKWKPTAVNWAFATAFFISQFVGAKKNLARRMLEANIQLPDPIWARLNVGWIVFFLFMGAINLYVAFNFPTDVWVNFKVFGIMGLTLLFVLAQAVYLMRHAHHPEQLKEKQ